MTPDSGPSGSRDRFEDEPGAEIMSQSWVPPCSHPDSLYVKELSADKVPEHPAYFLISSHPELSSGLWEMSLPCDPASLPFPPSFICCQTECHLSSPHLKIKQNNTKKPKQIYKNPTQTLKKEQPDSASKHPIGSEEWMPKNKKRKAARQVLSGVWQMFYAGKWHKLSKEGPQKLLPSSVLVPLFLV